MASARATARRPPPDALIPANGRGSAPPGIRAPHDTPVREAASPGTDHSTAHDARAPAGPALVAENAAIRAEIAGTRHGDGMSLVARVPINVFHNRLGEALKQGDDAFLRRWLNDPDHAAFRVRDGRI